MKTNIPTDEHIMVMTPEELDVKAAVGPMGGTPEPQRGYMGWRLPDGSYLTTMTGMMVSNTWFPTTDIAAAMKLEDRIEELGLIARYVFQMHYELLRCSDLPWPDDEWALFHASPLYRTRAAVLAWAASKRKQ